jgi:hypothetical protein
MLAGIITEGQYKEKLNEGYDEFMDNNYPGFKPEGEQSFVEFVNLVAKNVFTDGVNDPTMSQVNDWDTLFEYWEDFGDLNMYTKSDIIELAGQAGVSENDLEYILDLPQVSKLERG